ncbi:MAG: putative alpha-L-arabinofuranosidase [Pedosphaera sp.]|nr:putative alpha-L-arabinofuranosidase [Pedosphaera sp.]
MNHSIVVFLAGVLSASAAVGQVQPAMITVHADQVLHPVSRYLTGACLEDVNHEVYGGIYSQMIFGESFAEPAPPLPLKGFAMYGGKWTVAGDGSAQVAGGDGPKIVGDDLVFTEGEADVEMLFTEKGGGNAGFIVKVSHAGKALDEFNGYEVSLEPSGILVLGRHRQNWEPLRRVPCDVPINEWIKLSVRMKEKSLDVTVNGTTVLQYEDAEHPLGAGAVGLRTWRKDVRFRNLSVTSGNKRREYKFAYAGVKTWWAGVSGMWRALRRGGAEGEFSLETMHPFVGTQSQRITFTGGTGELGIANEGLNRRGMSFVGGSPYEGCLDVRADAATELTVALENADGSKVFCERSLSVAGNDWQHLEFVLTPTASENNGRFSIKLKQPGSVVVGYAFLQPGPWGRFQGLPVRKDVAEGLVAQGITVLRYGGSMVNAPGYRWKHMLGPRDRRPAYAGNWYPYSSDGWGIPDFLNLCEAAGFLGVPDLNVNETAQDMADFIDYVNGPTNSVLGAQRLADGHPQPYGLKYMELGNEERVDESYFQKFKSLAEAVWAKDANITIVVGDFLYSRTITDPFHFSGADSGITTLSAHQKILQLAKQHDREVWFDVHVGTDGPIPDASLAGMFSFDDALGRIAAGAKYKVVVFELNAQNHSQRRALGNAVAIAAIERDGRLPIVTSANCLQPDGQNDNGWDQGLLFLNPAQVWSQPPGYVLQMISIGYEPLLIQSEVESPNNCLRVSAKRSEDGKTLVLSVVNVSEKVTPAAIRLGGYSPARAVVEVKVLAGGLDAVNSATVQGRIQPVRKAWQHHFENGQAEYDFQPHSFTVIQFN